MARDRDDESAGRGKRRLSDAEHADWEAIARTIRPLAKTTRRVKGPPEPAARLSPPAGPPKPTREKTVPVRPAAPAPAQPPPRVRVALAKVSLPAIEPKVLRALKRGQIEPDARLDLHGETQASAHRHLERFLAGARRDGRRIVLIVTGKGLAGANADSERGVLRRMLPLWLAAPPLGEWVMGMAEAGPAHGGSGAAYVVLRRAR